jgi:3-isopropylmalate dehydrogenase
MIRRFISTQTSPSSRRRHRPRGDGRGRKKLIAWMNAKFGAGFETEEGLVGGCAYDAHGKAISKPTWQKAHGRRRRAVRRGRRPEVGRRALRGAPRSRPAAPAQGPRQLFANLRPAICYPALAAPPR